MRGFMIKVVIKVMRWVVLNLLLRPVLKKYVEIPLFGFLMKITGGDIQEEDVERGGTSGGVPGVAGVEGTGDSPV